MKRGLLFLAVLAAAAVAVAAAAAPAAVRPSDASLGPVTYDVCYRLAGITTKVATATITFEEAEREGKPAYHSTALIETQPFFRLFLKAKYTAEAWYSRDDLSPLYFVNPFKDGQKEGKYEVLYDYVGNIVRALITVGENEPVEKASPLGDKPNMDLLSVLAFLRFHDFKEGEPETVTLIMPSKNRDAGILQEDDHLLLQISGNGVMENGSGNKFLFWRSSGPDRRILRLEADLGSGSLRCTVHEP